MLHPIRVDGIDLQATLAPLTMLRDDPTVRLGPGRFDRATITPAGPATITVTWPHPQPPVAGDIRETTAAVAVHGDGATWLLQRASRLLGGHDDITGFGPDHPRLRELWRRHRGVRMTATGTLWHDLAWTIVQQRIHRLDAAAQWRRLVLAYGTPADDGTGLTIPPTPAALGRLGYAHLHTVGIERQRAEYLINAARAVTRVPHLTDEPFDQAEPVLRSLRGVGPWTIAGLSAFTWGEPDTVPLGDSGIPSMITWLLAGEPRGDDARMLHLLEPYRPHRYRVVQLAFAARAFPPKRHPRGGRTDIRRF